MLSRMMTRREQAVITGIAVAILVGSGVAYWQVSRKPTAVPAAVVAPLTAPPSARQAIPAKAIETEPADAAFVAEPDAEPEEIAVAIQGAVKQPGLYRLTDGARVQDLIDEAGGVLDAADVESINRAAALIDGTTLTIPEAYKRGFERREAVWNPPQYTVVGQLTPLNGSPVAPIERLSDQSASSAKTARGALDLNRATADDLETLPGIGPVLAAAIIDYRGSAPFAAVDDLLNVSGIGPKRLETIRPLVTVE